MRNQYNEQLKELHEQMIHMGNLCEEAISAAAVSIMGRTPGGRERAYHADEQIDKMERQIEDLCLRLLLQQQPVAGDLRRISAALKMISDMERIGDQAADIAELSAYLANSGLAEKSVLNDMAKAAVQMVNESIEAFVNADLELVHKVITDDDTVDTLFEQLRTDLPQVMVRGEMEARVGLDLLMAGKYLERIGDHAVNIAEWVEFSITGKHKNHEHQLWEH